MRLIDADALSKDLEKRWNVNDDQDFCNKEVWHALEEAPTIEPDADTISRSQAIKDVSEWATDILHPDRLVKEDAIHILESLPSAEQVTGKLNNPDDSLLTADSEACKEQKSKLDLISRQDAWGAIEHWGRSRGNLTNNQIAELQREIESLPSAETPTNTPTDLIRRSDALKPFCIAPDGTRIPEVDCDNFPVEFSVEFIKKHLLSLPSAPESIWRRGVWVTTAPDSHVFTDKFQENIRENIFGGADMRKGGEEE